MPKKNDKAKFSTNIALINRLMVASISMSPCGEYGALDIHAFLPA